MYLTTKATASGRLVVDMVTGCTAAYDDIDSYWIAERSLLDYRHAAILKIFDKPVPVDTFDLATWQNIYGLHFVYGIARLSLP